MVSEEDCSGVIESLPVAVDSADIEGVDFFTEGILRPVVGNDKGVGTISLPREFFCAMM